MSKDNTFLCEIPFSGFYYSLHDSAIDDTFDRLFMDYDTGCSESAPEWLISKARDAVDWSAVQRDYAKEYAESFLYEMGLSGTFESMTSPKYYNFETDRVFVYLTRDDLAKVWKGVDKEDFTAACVERLTSRSGFISHYDPDWHTWGRLSDWDHNQLGVLISVYANAQDHNGEFDSMAEYYLMEDAQGNGRLDNWLFANATDILSRCVDVWTYLQERDKREVKTMAGWHAARRAENRPFTATPLGQWSN